MIIIDKITNFWFQHISFTHQLIRKLFFRNHKKPWKIIRFVTRRDTIDPSAKKKTYRPIICLPSTYKLTSMLKGRRVKFIECKDIFPLEQKVMLKWTIWLLRSAAHKQDDHGELSIQTEKSKYGLDWPQKKTIDSEPYEYILKVLNTFKVFPVIMTFLKYNIESGFINLRFIHEKGMLKIYILNINNEIFQGNALSLFLFFFFLYTFLRGT